MNAALQLASEVGTAPACAAIGVARATFYRHRQVADCPCRRRSRGPHRRAPSRRTNAAWCSTCWHRGRPHGRDELLQVNTRVPYVEHSRLAVFGHPIAIRANTRQHRVTGIVFVVAVIAAGEYKARGQTLQIPFPWSGKCFVEVVDVDDHSPFRSGECTEVAKMAIATCLHCASRLLAWSRDLRPC